MEIRVKFKKQAIVRTLRRHINFDVNHLRDNARLITINHKDPENERLLKEADALTKRTTTCREENNKIWNLVKEILTAQEKEFPHRGDQINRTHAINNNEKKK